VQFVISEELFIFLLSSCIITVYGIEWHSCEMINCSCNLVLDSSIDLGGSSILDLGTHHCHIIDTVN